MVRHCRHMCSHGRYRISEGSAILDPKPVNSIRVVAAPDLRCVIQHACVKSSATAAAALDQKIRITFHHTVQKIVQSQDIIIHYTSLILSHYGKYIHQASIHVPFNVLNIGIIQYRTDLSEDSVYNFFSGKIKYQLISGSHWFSSRNRKCPVLMLAVKITVLRDHLRLDPDTEFHSEVIDSFYQSAESLSKFLLIDIPVPKATVVIVTFSEPAVIQNQHIDTKALCLFCQII